MGKKLPSEAQKTAFIVLGIIFSFTGFITTFLFQQISKKDNDLRQRGRYLVTLQGYSETIFLIVMLYNSAFSATMPCFVIFHASYLVLVPFVLVLTGRAWRLITRIQRNQDIYQTRFADPTDLAELTRAASTQGNKSRERTLLPARGHSSSRLSPSLVNLTSLRQQSSQSRHQQDAIDQHDRVFELTEKSQKDIARSNKWYNRYKKATDRQMVITGVTYMAISVIIDVVFMITTRPVMLTIDHGDGSCPVEFLPYLFPYITYFIFLFILSPTMIYQLNGVNDGYGIRKELIWISLFSLPCISLFFALPKIAKPITDVVDEVYFMALILVAAHIPSIIMPLIRHYRANPYQCRCRNRKEHASKGNEGTGATHTDRDHGRGRIVATSANNLPVEEGSTQPSARQQWFNGSNGQLSPPVETKCNQQGERDQLPLHTQHTNQQENNTSGFNAGIKNIIRNQQRNRFGFGSSEHAETIRHIKTDWDEFIKALEDRRMFDHISAFTVAEFCAENTRFLYEVARLEKRATQYERLRELTSGSQDAVEPVGSTADLSTLAQQEEEFEKGSNVGARESTLGPLPTHFGSAHRLQLDEGKGSQRIKKIVSVSSVSSTMPMLGSRRSSSSLFDESEPSSPLGSSSHSTFKRYGGSSTALPDLEEGISENQEAGNPTAPIHLDIINMPNTPFAPLPMPPTLLIQFEYVYNTFIASGARLELNLSHETVQEIHQRAKKCEWGSGMFDGATFEVQELLFRDVWPKFVSSSRGLLAFEPDEPQYQPTDKFGTTSMGSRTTVFLPFDHHQLSRQPTSSSPAHSIKSPKSSLSKATSTRSVATPSVEPSAGAPSGSGQCDTFSEEHSRTGFKIWLDKKNRSGITAATLISREGDTEESLGIIEQSRRSTADRRSDTSNLYSNSTLIPPA
ncbi:hypothetical protein EC957_002809 [Mortierella hygrophila]|uniref:RGS domain-containing protein n=1 Tax=Mortierella hygrophila TaxID=979708 RepID=A0A9P6FFP3_9FUNG|nr:hypothetical protein EC957_002809 [Mortierella hygrophila]